jgi:hypothetical protein
MEAVSSVSSPVSVTVQLATPTLGDVIAVTNHTVSVAWEAVPYANGYVIQYATNSEFTGASTKIIDSQSTTSTTLTELNPGTTY